MGGTLMKAGVGVVLVVAAAKMGDVAQKILGRARVSVQASELLTIDGHLAAWAIEQKRTRPPRDQEQFEIVLKGLFSAGGRDVTLDRWNHPYRYEKVHDRPVAWRITSLGPDGQLATTDDIVVRRYDDRVETNTDPVAVAEGAIEDKRRADERFFRDLSRVAARAGRPIEIAPPAGSAEWDSGKLPERSARHEAKTLDDLLSK